MSRGKGLEKFGSELSFMFGLGFCSGLWCLVSACTVEQSTCSSCVCLVPAFWLLDFLGVLFCFVYVQVYTHICVHIHVEVRRQPPT